MMKRVHIILIILLFPGICCIKVNAQDPQLSQFYSAPLYLGPSFAGSEGVPRMGMNVRSQWVQLPQPFLTTSAYADMYIEKYKLGTGISIMYDDAGGLLNTLFISTQYSYRISINNRWFFVPGIQAQYFSRKINSGALIFSDQIIRGEILPTSIDIYDDSRYHHFDFAISGLVFNDRLWFGITGNHLMKLNPDIPVREEYSPFLFSAYGGIVFDMLSRAHITKVQKNITVAFNYKTQEHLNQLDIGLYHITSPFMIGIWYRGIPVISNTQSRDAISLLGGYTTGLFSIAYCYDITMSKLVNTTGGSHEISINYKFRNTQNRRKRIRAIPCPEF
jgi:type IX secretion system PorP/SprF family membrane protein